MMRSDGRSCGSDEEVERLVRALQSLVDGESAIDQLVACGLSAIPALREFLLHGRVTSVPQPRMWSVEALGRLEAREVLIEYLEAPNRALDAQLCFAEDAVRNTAARHLGRWHDSETFAVLLDLCRKRLLPGVIEAIAGFERIEAIPYLDRALEDDFCRGVAEEGLRRIGPAARGALLLSAITPLPNAADETPSSLGRRRRALTLLADMTPDAEDWSVLRDLLNESDAEVTVKVARIAAQTAPSNDRVVAAEKLVAALERVPWHAVKEAEETLLSLAPESMGAIHAEQRRRAARPPLVRAGDEVFRLLVRLSGKLTAIPTQR